MFSLVLKAIIAIAIVRSIIRFSKARRLSDALFFFFWLALVGTFWIDSRAYLLLPLVFLIAASIQKQKDSVPASLFEDQPESEPEPLILSEPKNTKAVFRPTSDEEEAASDPEEFLERIPEFADDCASLAKSLMGKDLDYSPESLQVVDDIITSSWGDSPPALLDPLLITFGSYLGETIRRNLGGSWQHSEEEGYHLTEITNPGTKAFPFTKIRKRFLDGEGDSVAFFFRALRHTIEKESRENENS